MIQHHPKIRTLAEFAAGTLDEGRSLVIATHMAMCPHCRGFVSAMEEVGGAMLDEIEPVAMSQGARRALAAIDAKAKALRKRKPVRPVLQSAQRIVVGYQHGPGGGSGRACIIARRMSLAAGTRVFMLRAAPE